ncbi:uncharacterized protein LOC125555579 [Triticum urartu]|uniref:uncharacterized protein LOC125555579 n=1 Tax=Triticum urartu TaxID=4572 RepID=UPI002044212B|nr:uncharacterized protein LOC125555579 [Triticum urartu]
MYAGDVLGLGMVCKCRSILVVPYDFAMEDPLAAENATDGDAVRAGFSVRRKSDVGWYSEWRPPDASAPTLRLAGRVLLFCQVQAGRARAAAGHGLKPTQVHGGAAHLLVSSLHFVESAATASPIDVLFYSFSDPSFSYVPQ